MGLSNKQRALTRQMVDQALTLYRQRDVFDFSSNSIIVLKGRISLHSGFDEDGDEIDDTTLFPFIAFDRHGRVWFKVKAQSRGIPFYNDKELCLLDEPIGSRYYVFHDLIIVRILSELEKIEPNDPDYFYAWGGWEFSILKDEQLKRMAATRKLDNV